MKQYDVINISDPCTVESDDPIAAAVGVLMISEGGFGLTSEDGETILPILMLGGVEEWLKAKEIEDLGDYIRANRIAIADALDSCMYGDFNDRAAYNKGLELVAGDEAKTKEWKDHWEEKRRTSMSKICQAAWAYAKQLRELKVEDARLEG